MIKSCIIGLFFFFCCSTLFAKNLSQNNILIENEVNRILNQYDTNLNIGIKIVNLDNGKVLYERNANRSFLPASNQKIFTATAALLKLGSDYIFKTKVLIDNNSLLNNQLNGNLYFQFSGAPDLKTKDINYLINGVKQLGINRIKGDVIVDASAFGSEMIGPGWMWDDTRYCFSAPISANIINENCVQFHVSPAGQVGKPLIILPNYTNQYVNLSNETVTKDKGKKGCYLRVMPGDNKDYVMSGCLPLTKTGIGLSIAMYDPNTYTKAMLKKLLKENGILVTGNVIEGETPLIVQEVAAVNSQPLSALVTTMLKKSDNLISDSLFKTLGNTCYGKPGTWKTGAKAVQTILTQHYKINFKNTVMIDGSGLSRYNLTTPDHFIQLLQGIYNDPNLAATIRSALPSAGINGTLQNRMKEPMVRNHVHAKTGAMAGVTALSGYIETGKKNNLAFSIIINGAPGPVYKFRKIEDQLCRYLAQNF